MLLRQVQARPLQGHHLRALRRGGHAAEGSSRAHGSHRPGRARVSHIWFFKGVPSRIGYLLDIAPKELEKVLYFAASIVTAVDKDKRGEDLADLEDKVRAESEQVFVDRDEQLAALEDRLSRRRDYFIKGKERNFDEDDEFWARGLIAWAEEQGLPAARGGAHARRRPLRRCRQEDHHRGREEDPRARPGRCDPRRPPALHARARPGRDRCDADPRGSRAAARRVRQGDRRQEGRGHEAHGQDPRRAAFGHRARGRRRRARLRRRR